jgi:NAD(P)-dependent dehydrogenase (short-subunit alcohol dehydrogenase family)
MLIEGKVAIVTGAASGIGRATAEMLAQKGVKGIGLVDMSESVEELAREINEANPGNPARAFIGDTTSSEFRKSVFNSMRDSFGAVGILVPAAGITRDAIAVKMNRESGEASIYPEEKFRLVTEVNLVAPIYWSLELVAQQAEERAERGLNKWDPEEGMQGAVVFIGSVASQGNKGQVAYASAKAGLEGATATLSKEAIFHGVRCGIIHPGFTDTPMVRAMGEEKVKEYILPYTEIQRLVRPDEIADAICFMISNSAVSGALWADAGWHPHP